MLDFGKGDPDVRGDLLEGKGAGCRGKGKDDFDEGHEAEFLAEEG